MRSLSVTRSNWSGGAKTPELSMMHWNLLAIPAAVLAVMAVLQIISFGKFKDWLDSIRVGWPAVVAVALIVGELVGAICLLRIPMNAMWRWLGISLGVLAAGFWFIENLYLATSSNGQLPTSGFFGKYLNQPPGWWTILEVSIGLFWIVFAAELLKWNPRNR